MKEEIENIERGSEKKKVERNWSMKVINESRIESRERERVTKEVERETSVSK